MIAVTAAREEWPQLQAMNPYMAAKEWVSRSPIQ
jgi:hypothetical protein